MAHAIRVSSYGGPEALEYVELPRPVAAPDQVLIEVRAAGVNPVDSKVRSGLRGPADLKEPIGIGSDASGVLVDFGSDVDGWAVGDEVIGSGLKWAYQSHVAATPSQIIRKPAALAFDRAAAIGVPVGTAYQLLKSLRLTEGETILIHSGSGGVGQAAIQLAVRSGAVVVATASPANHDRIRELGGIPVAYGPGLLERVREAAPQGIDTVLDAAGTQEAIDVSLELVADRGRIGEIVNPAWHEKYGVLVFSGGLPGSMGPTEIALRAEGVALVADLAARGKFQLEIAASFPLSDAAEAARLSDTGHVRGKIVLIP